uniref:Uncharacterized protein n=2 Tax=Aegilops tauschii subsp. strangulata TaxID=200361 RepID=A0A453H4Z3_AEGTS
MLYGGLVWTLGRRVNRRARSRTLLPFCHEGGAMKWQSAIEIREVGNSCLLYWWSTMHCIARVTLPGDQLWG